MRIAKNQLVEFSDANGVVHRGYFTNCGKGHGMIKILTSPKAKSHWWVPVEEVRIVNNGNSKVSG